MREAVGGGETAVMDTYDGTARFNFCFQLCLLVKQLRPRDHNSAGADIHILCRGRVQTLITLLFHN